MGEIKQFPGTTPVLPTEDEDEINCESILNAFVEDADDLQDVLVIAVCKTNGRVAWGSSTGNLPEILWLCKAMERIAMDHSMGLIRLDDE